MIFSDRQIQYSNWKTNKNYFYSSVKIPKISKTDEKNYVPVTTN